MIYHCVVNLQIMEDQMTPARSFVLNVSFLKHLLIFYLYPLPIFSRFYGETLPFTSS